MPARVLGVKILYYLPGVAALSVRYAATAFPSLNCALDSRIHIRDKKIEVKRI